MGVIDTFLKSVFSEEDAQVEPLQKSIDEGTKSVEAMLDQVDKVSDSSLTKGQSEPQHTDQEGQAKIRPENETKDEIETVASSEKSYEDRKGGAGSDEPQHTDQEGQAKITPDNETKDEIETVASSEKQTGESAPKGKMVEPSLIKNKEEDDKDDKEEDDKEEDEKYEGKEKMNKSIGVTNDKQAELFDVTEPLAVLKKAVDFLANENSELKKSVETLVQSQTEDRELLKALVASTTKTFSLTKSVAQELDSVTNTTPAPKGQISVFRKSVGEEAVTSDVAVDGYMETLVKNLGHKNLGGQVANAIAAYECTGQVNESLYKTLNS